MHACVEALMHLGMSCKLFFLTTQASCQAQSLPDLRTSLAQARGPSMGCKKHAAPPAACIAPQGHDGQSAACRAHAEPPRPLACWLGRILATSRICSLPVAELKLMRLYATSPSFPSPHPPTCVFFPILHPIHLRFASCTCFPQGH